MKRIIISFIGIFSVISSSLGAGIILEPKTHWWEKGNWFLVNPAPVCEIVDVDCYSNMNKNLNAYCPDRYNVECWDAGNNCWGKKYICANALVPASDQNKLLSKSEIASAKLISPDFNIDEVDGDCFGVRKTYNNGLYASVNNERVRVWCKNIPIDWDEELPNGYLILSASNQPTCSELAEMEYAALKNNTCWGKKYSRNTYYIDCHSNTVEPYRFIILNGINHDDIQDDPNSLSESEVKARFQSLYDEAQIQHKKYFR